MATQELEKKAENDRARLSDTLDALRDRMAPKELAEQAFEYARENGGADFVRNLGSQAKSNPIPIVLVAAGLGWLMFGRPAPVAAPSPRRVGRFWGTNSRNGTSLDERFDSLAQDNTSRYTDPRYSDRAALGVSSARSAASDAAGRLQGSASSALESAGDAAGRAKDAAGTAARSAGDAASNAANSVRDAAGQAAEAARGAVGELGERAAALRDSASEFGRSAADQARDARDYAAGMGRTAAEQARAVSSYASDLSDTAAQYAGEARGQARYAGERIADGADRAQATVRRVAREQPLVLGAVGLALGAILGAVLPRSQREDELMGDAADDIKTAAMDKARAGLSEAKDAGARIGERIRDEAQAQGLSTGSVGELTRTLGDKVTSIAAAAREGVESELAEAKTKAEGEMDKAEPAATNKAFAANADTFVHEAANASLQEPALTRFSELDPSPTLLPEAGDPDAAREEKREEKAKAVDA